MSMVSNTGTYPLSNNHGLESNNAANGTNNDWSNSTRFINSLNPESASNGQKNINKRHTDQIKTNGDTQSMNRPNTDSSTYDKPLEQKSYLEFSKIKQQNIGNSKNISNEKSIKNYGTLTTSKAYAIINSDAINIKTKTPALDFIADKSTKGDSPSRFFSNKEERIQDFCSTLTKDIKDTDAFLNLRKNVFPFASLSTTENSTNRHLFVDGLIKEIDQTVNKKLDEYIKDKTKYAASLKNPEQIKKMYEEAFSHITHVKSNMPTVGQQLSQELIERKSILALKDIDNVTNKNLQEYVKKRLNNFLGIENSEQLKTIYEEMLSHIKDIKSNMPAVAKNMTSEQIEKESTALLVKELANICTKNDFNFTRMLEKQVLPEEANLIFTAYTNEAIKNEINHLKEENERQAWTYPLFRARKYTTDPNILNTISINNDRISELEAIQSDSL